MIDDHVQVISLGFKMSNKEHQSLMKDRIDYSRAAELISRLHALIAAMMVIRGPTGDADSQPEEIKEMTRDLGRLTDLYLYDVIKATNETAPGLAEVFLYLTEDARQRGDIFYAGFFFALSYLLSLRLSIQEGSENDRREFERNFTQTLEKFGLTQAEHTETNGQDQSRKSQPARYVL
jgi:hypothetical protein